MRRALPAAPSGLRLAVTRDGKRGQFYRITTQHGGTAQCRTAKRAAQVIRELEAASVSYADSALRAELGAKP